VSEKVVFWQELWTMTLRLSTRWRSEWSLEHL